MSKYAGDDYKQFVQETNEIPEVQEYLRSFPVIIGDLVAARRQQLGWSQQELAAKSGTTQARISKIEHADGGVKMETIGKVFEALRLADIHLDYLAAAREV